MRGLSAHNDIYRGKDLTNIYSIEEICKMASKGTYKDLYIGDYITVSIPTVSYTYSDGTAMDLYQDIDIVFAGFNNLRHGSIEVTQNHITCVTRDCFQRVAPMNITDTAKGGYKGSLMHTVILPEYAAALQTVLNNHIITHSSYGNTFVIDTQLCLLNEVQLFGSVTYSSSWDIVEGEGRNAQFPLFRLKPELKVAHLGRNSVSKQWYWLSPESYSAVFTTCSDNGKPNCSYASNWGGIRPYFLIG